MPITMHDFIVLWIGVFIGLFLGSPKFRKVCSDFIGHLGNMKPKEQPKQEKQQPSSNEDGEEYFDRNGHRVIIRRGRGTTIREIHFDD
jgi:hypothetical protein